MDILKVYIHKYIKLKLVEKQRYAKKKKLLSVKWTEKYKKKEDTTKKKMANHSFLLAPQRTKPKYVHNDPNYFFLVIEHIIVFRP